MAIPVKTSKFQRNESYGLVSTTTTLTVRDLIKLEPFLQMTDFLKEFAGNIGNGNAVVIGGIDCENRLEVQSSNGIVTLSAEGLFNHCEKLETFLKNMGVTSPTEEGEPIF